MLRQNAPCSIEHTIMYSVSASGLRAGGVPSGTAKKKVSAEPSKAAAAGYARRGLDTADMAVACLTRLGL